jgi:siroheme synthase-like protein
MQSETTLKETNRLFPVFLKLEEMKVLIVGGGKVGLEKLNAILSNSPATKVTLVSITISKGIKELVSNYPNVELEERVVLSQDMKEPAIVIIAVNNQEESKRISNMAKAQGKLVNVADKPELCDFYMSSIVQKGNVKIAISTNGKSPTIAKRLKEILNNLLPDSIDHLVENMHSIRLKLKGDFTNKVNKLNHITRELTVKELNI